MNGIELKNKMRSKQPCLGAWVTLTDLVVSELMSHAGFDFLFVDAEHSVIPLEKLAVMLLMMQRGQTPAIVRVSANDPDLIKQTLDVGAEGIMVPMVQTPDDASRAVRAAKYPPLGIRGYGPMIPTDFYRDENGYVSHANERTTVIIQVEDIATVESLERVLEVPGIDGVFVGPADLSFSMGIPLEMDHPDLLKAIGTIAAKSRKAGIPFGASAGIAKKLDWQVEYVTLGSDYSLMQSAAKDIRLSTLKAMGR